MSYYIRNYTYPSMFFIQCSLNTKKTFVKWPHASFNFRKIVTFLCPSYIQYTTVSTKILFSFQLVAGKSEKNPDESEKKVIL